MRKGLLTVARERIELTTNGFSVHVYAVVEYKKIQGNETGI